VIFQPLGRLLISRFPLKTMIRLCTRSIQCASTTEQSMIYSVDVYSSPTSSAGIAIIGLEVQNKRDQIIQTHTYHHS